MIRCAHDPVVLWAVSVHFQYSPQYVVAPVQCCSVEVRFKSFWSWKAMTDDELDLRSKMSNLNPHCNNFHFSFWSATTVPMYQQPRAAVTYNSCCTTAALFFFIDVVLGEGCNYLYTLHLTCINNFGSINWLYIDGRFKKISRQTSRFVLRNASVCHAICFGRSYKIDTYLIKTQKLIFLS